MKNFALPLEDLTKSELRQIGEIPFVNSNTRRQQREKRCEIMNTSILKSGGLSAKQQKQVDELYKKLSKIPDGSKLIKGALRSQPRNAFKIVK